MKKNSFRDLYILCLLLLSFNIEIKAQQNYFTVKGRVISNENVLLNLVSVRVGSIGTITNQKGEFALIFSRDRFTKDKLILSSIGFSTRYFSIDSLIKNNVKFLEISLSESATALHEVTVATGGRSIIQKAIDKIPENYPNHLVGMTGFFRESNQDKQGYLFLSEGLLRIVTPSYERNSDNEVQILQYRKKVFERTDTTQFIRLGGGALLASKFDFVHQDFDFVQGKELKNYQYKIVDIVSLKGRDVYVISFQPLNKKVNFQGRLYIDYERFAFIKAEFSIARLDEKRIGLIETTKFDVQVNYNDYEDKWYLNNIWYRENVKLKKVENIIVLEYVTTEIDTADTRTIGYADKVQSRDIFMETNHPFDDYFWKNFNHILQDDKLKQELNDKSRDSLATQVFTDKVRKTGHSQFNWQNFSYNLAKRINYEISVQAVGVTHSLDNITISPQNLNIFDIDHNYLFSKSRYIYSLHYGLSLDILPNFRASIKSMRNFGIGDYNFNSELYGLSYSFKFNSLKRPIRLTTRLSYENYTLCERLDSHVKSVSGQFISDNQKLAGDELALNIVHKKTYLTSALGLELEIKRTKHFFVETGYNIPIGSDRDFLQLKETSGFFLFRKSIDIPFSNTGLSFNNIFFRLGVRLRILGEK